MKHMASCIANPKQEPQGLPWLPAFPGLRRTVGGEHPLPADHQLVGCGRAQGALETKGGRFLFSSAP